MADSTIDYYNRLSREFSARTREIDMSALYEPFLALIPENGYILDAGCGSGRDSKAFLDRGYRVMSIDGSRAMAEITSGLTGQQAYTMRFQEVNFREEFDAIWACGSLLHVPRHDMRGVLEKLATALKPNGAMYMSFKTGQQDEIRDGRLFTNYTEAAMRKMLAQVGGMEILTIWTTPDIREDANRPDWLNILLQKQP